MSGFKELIDQMDEIKRQAAAEAARESSKPTEQRRFESLYATVCRMSERMQVNHDIVEMLRFSPRDRGYVLDAFEIQMIQDPSRRAAILHRLGAKP